MKTDKRKALYVFLVLFIHIVINTGLQGQDSVSTAKPITGGGQQGTLVRPRPAVRVAKKVIKPEDLFFKGSLSLDLAKVEASSYMVYNKVFKPVKIEARYYRDNFFDVGISENPFALPRKKRPGAKSKKDRAKTLTVISKEFFAFNNRNLGEGEVPVWLKFIFLGIFALLALNLNLFSRELGHAFRTFFFTNNVGGAYREEQNNQTIGYGVLYAYFALVLGVFCYLIPLRLLGITEYASFGALISCVVLVGGIYFLKHLKVRLLTFVLPFPKEIEQYNFLIAVSNRVIGIVMIPFVFMSAYMSMGFKDEMIYISLGIWGILFLIRSLKSIFVTSDIIFFHKVHFFIYLCTVEIIPTLILMKLLSII